MKYVPATICLLALAAAACLDEDSGRSYASFEEDYLAIQNGTYVGPTFDVGSSADVVLVDEPDLALPPATQCSVDGTAVNVTFVNKTGSAGDVYWVSHDCSQISYGPLGVDERRAQGTFAGHVWRLYSPTVGLLGELVVTGPEGSELTFE